MSTNLMNLTFDGKSVRTVVLDSVVFWVARDVCSVLGYADPKNAVKQHCKGVAKYHPLSTPGGMQEVRIISEADVLRLIVNSKLPEADRFERWVFEEALPTILKSGSYSALPSPSLQEFVSTDVYRINNHTLEIMSGTPFEAVLSRSGDLRLIVGSPPIAREVAVVPTRDPVSATPKEFAPTSRAETVDER